MSARESQDARVAGEEAEVARRLVGVDAALAEYHGLADRLALVPASAKRAEGVAFEVRLDRGAGSAGEMINVDLKGLVKPALQRLRDGYGGRARGLAEEMLSLQVQGRGWVGGAGGWTRREQEQGFGRLGVGLRRVWVAGGGADSTRLVGGWGGVPEPRVEAPGGAARRWDQHLLHQAQQRH